MGESKTAGSPAASRSAGTTADPTSGVLLHITSLPSRFPIGDLGPTAHRFADWLARAGQREWQVLPLVPTDPLDGNSPYRSRSAFATSPLLVSPELLVRDHLLSRKDIARHPRFTPDRVDYIRTERWKCRLLDRAFKRFQPGPDYFRFCADNASWLDDFALFVVLRRRFDDLAWPDWPRKLRDRDPAALAEIAGTFERDLDRERFIQFAAFTQWNQLRRRCSRLGIRLTGDLPIYVDHDSADAWANPRLFMLDRNRRPAFVAGVPPDRFSPTGQLWGNPVYDWPRHRRTGFRWWTHRFERALRLFDRVRLDHFRGLIAYWRIPAGSRTAAKGRWVRAPGADLLTALQQRLERLPIVAEDLGLITPPVTALRRRFRLPGSRVLQFGFGPNSAICRHHPDNAEPDSVLYTGTHDNNTLRGWFEREATPADRARLAEWLGCDPTARTVAKLVVERALSSRARTVIIAAQDIFGLDARARMNAPATETGNWEWRLRPDRLTGAVARRLRQATRAAGRCPS